MGEGQEGGKGQRPYTLSKLKRSSFINTPTGTLYIIATPIGNLADISSRAIATLNTVDAIAAEDTRHSLRLLQHFNITTPLFALHEHNERDSAVRIIERLQAGQSLAIISDAGTPLISDPGYHVVKAAHAADINVCPIPGPCALIMALSVAGLPTDRFIFEGFLSAKSTARQLQLQALAKEPRTIVLYEAPHRIIDLLVDLITLFGPTREMVIARELSKTFETIKTGTTASIHDWVLSDKNQQKGEFVVLIKGFENEQATISDEVLKILDILVAEKLPLKQAVSLCAKITDHSKNKLYQLALQRYHHE